MKRLDGLRESLRYIEANLHGEVDHDVVAEKACLSKFYYYRLFHIVTGVTLGEYIRNRRMTLAARELQTTQRKIVDIALDYGYGSPEAFSRAFKSVHGLSPTHGRDANVRLKAHPPISFQLQLRGGAEMDYRVEKKDAFQVVGVRKRVTTKKGANFKVIPAYWDEVMKDGTLSKIMQLPEGECKGCYGICLNHDPDKEEFDYAIGVQGAKKGSAFETIHVPGSAYAIFGPVKLDALRDLWQRIFSEWLPATEYQLTGGPEVEYYPPCEGDPVCEVWMPIKQ